MAKPASIRIAPDLLPPPANTVEVVNVKTEWMQAIDSLPEPLAPEGATGLRQLLQATSGNGTPRVILIAREYGPKRRKLSSCVLGALYGVGLDGRTTLLVDLILGNYALLGALAAELQEISKMGNLRSPAQISGVVAPSGELLRAAGFETYTWQGHSIWCLEAA